MDNDDFRPGDLAACCGTDLVGRAITWGTASLFAPKRLRLGPSHIAVLCGWHGGHVWVESTSLCKHPCAFLGFPRSGAQAHLPEDRVRDYVEVGGRVDLYRLSPVDRLSMPESELLSRILVRHFIGKLVGYDTGGALLSGTRVFKHTRLLPGADLEQLFCSELAAKVFVADGADWCWAIRDRCFPEAEGVLDWYHLAEHVWTAARIVAPDDARSWADDALGHLADGGGPALADRLVDEHRSRRGRPRSAIGKLPKYLRPRFELTESPRHRTAGRPIGSGTVESTNKQLVAGRPKGPGMHWTDAGALTITALRAHVLNRTWHDTWRSLAP